jgi:cytochrome P450
MSAQPPGPTGLPIVGDAYRYARDPFEFMQRCAETYGDIVQFDLGPVKTYMVTDPGEIERILVSDDHKYHKPTFQGDALGELLGDGLLLSEEATWRKQRQIAQPAFAPGRLWGLDEQMVDHTERMLEEWADGQQRDVEIDMARVTVQIIVDAMLGANLDDQRAQVVRENLEPLGRRFEPDPLRPLIPDWAPTQENREYEAAIERLEGILEDIVETRRGTEHDAPDPGADGDQPMDLLSLLLRAQQQGEQSDKQIRDEMMTMLLAGHDTTALTLTYAWYLLAEHPEVEARFHAELDEVLDGETPTAAAVEDLEYTERVIQETMRLYPPVYAIFREPQVDVRLGDYRIPAGSAVLLPQWVVHRSPRFWDDPETFDPDRWAETSERERFSYFPFGGGPRHCIGKSLSLLEATLILGTVGQRYSLERVGEGPLDLRPSLTMHPENGMEMRLHRRE